MPNIIDKQLHDVLSRLLQDYPKLWHHRRGSIKDQYLKLATKLSEKLHRPVSEKKVRTVLKNVRRHLQRLEKGLSRKTNYCAYLWYAEELGYMRATETISKIIEEKAFFEQEVALNEEHYASSSNSAPSIKEEFEEYMNITEKVTLNEEHCASPSEECLQMMKEEYDGPPTSAQAAQISENRRLRAESLLQQAPSNTEGEEVLPDILTIHDSEERIDKQFHDVLSRLLQDYPKLWHHRRGPIKDQYLKLATKLSEKLHRPVSEKKVRSVLKNVRRHLQRLEKGLSRKTSYCPYLWYAKELGYMRATETISKIIEEKEFIEQEVALNEEHYASSSNSAPSIKEEFEEYMDITEEVTLNEKHYASPSEECLQMMKEEYDGPSTSAQAAQIRENRRLRAESPFQEAPSNTEEEDILPDVLTIHDSEERIDKQFHDVLSRLLQDYPKLWHHRRGPIKDQYLKLAKKLSEKLHRPVSEKKVRTVLKNVRRHLQRLEKGLSRKTRYCAYLWYAEELGYMRATETISKIIEEKEFIEQEVALNGEHYASSSNSAPSIKEEFEEFMDITEEVALNEEHYANPSEECLQMMKAAQRCK
uniref:Uncharacterized protein n=1 Tax=Glossina morsitans morsitans TaxID=37546 RepID=A0A1B0FQ12_GLOMM